MMTQDGQQNDSRPVPGYNKPQQLMNKYDEQTSSNRINMHPSRSFKYLQQMTSDEQQPGMTTTTTTTTVTRTGNSMDLNRFRD